MKKRLLSGIVTLLCVMLCASGLAACGEDNGTEAVAVESVTLNKTELTLEIGGEETLTATVTPDNATNKTVVWSSDNPAVVTVADGKITAVAAGTATITATADGKSATCSVTVNTPAPQNSVAGKTFAFKDVTCQSADASLLLQMKEANSGATMAFGTDGTTIYTMPAQSVVQKFAYVQNGATITCELVEFRMNGEAVPFDEQSPIQFTVENGELVQELTIHNVVYTAIYELQSAE